MRKYHTDHFGLHNHKLKADLEAFRAERIKRKKQARILFALYSVVITVALSPLLAMGIQDLLK